ncbi:hypothetical protein D9758_000762 [Tetrapyrgos nigripes]|uniref:Adenosine deaminase n=1 Tax=Tetrapyrgos nigripes TaxID=182062 RepID=A0A8H5GZ15_9AGAR|nr:hypothetical protein D9758_000762 [Tetrapyrgos nigripes]
MASSLSEYTKQRDELIKVDQAQRADRKRGPLSPAEALADKVIRDLRAVEATTLWSAEHPSIPHPFPGMEFLTGRNIIMQSKLFEILSKMPKGSLLHAHLDATVNVPFLLDLALKQPAIHVRTSTALNASNLRSVLPEFQAHPQDAYTMAQDVTSLTDVNYTLNIGSQ